MPTGKGLILVASINVDERRDPKVVHKMHKSGSSRKKIITRIENKKLLENVEQGRRNSIQSP